MKMKPPKVSPIKRLFLMELIRGLMVTLREQFNPHFTVEYPRERIPLRPRFRGVPRLRNHPENGEDLCIGCNQCALACPDNCITVVAEPRPEGALLKGKRAKVFVIDYERCCLCGLCVDPCPTEPITAIYMSHDFELAHYQRDRFVTSDDLLYKGHDVVEYKK